MFGAETWVLTPRMERALDSFQYRVARQITRRHPIRQVERGWEYTTLEAAREEEDFE